VLAAAVGAIAAAELELAAEVGAIAVPEVEIAAAADELVRDGLVVARRALMKTRGLGIASPVDAALELVLAAEVGAIAVPELVLAAEVGAIAAPELELAAEVGAIAAPELELEGVMACVKKGATEPFGFRRFIAFMTFGAIASTRKKW
jgi:hypothetical protein